MTRRWRRRSPPLRWRRRAPRRSYRAISSSPSPRARKPVGWLARNHRDLIDAELALNEGGGLTVTPDLSRMESVEIGVAEKTFQSYSLIVKGKGGHSSMPPTNSDPVVTLARALQRVGELRFPGKVLPEAR